jgi:phospholipid/cholesterol/gamma-HCH transport system substrate-binding protein
MLTLESTSYQIRRQVATPQPVRAIEPGAKVKLRGVEVGRVTTLSGRPGQTSLRVALDPDQRRLIPANVEVDIKATTAFGAKYVELAVPDDPTRERLVAGAVLRSGNVSTEVNTVFENVVDLLNRIDVFKINATLTALVGVCGTNSSVEVISPRRDLLRR